MIEPRTYNKMNKFAESFEEFGFAFCKASAPEKLLLLRDTMVQEACDLLGVPLSDSTEFLDDFHRRGIKDEKLNNFRVELIKRFNAKFEVGDVVFEAFKDTLFGLVGPDVAVQKSTNIVIQQPGDIGVSPIHRDAPPNSPFEVVVWIPLVHCYGTKGFSVVGLDESADCASALRDNEPEAMEVMSRRVLAPDRFIEIDFGHGLFFWASLFHAVPVNVERETRWSLNLRFKNLFSPYGGKGLPDFFRIGHLSPLSKLAIENEKRNMLGNELAVTQ